MRDASFTDYIHSLSRYDYSIWKPIKNRRKPNIASPPIRATTPTAVPGQEVIKKNPNSLHNILLTYLLRITMQRTMK
jgi:hypothetical protein